MNKKIIGIAVFGFSLIGCNSSGNKSGESQNKSHDTAQANQPSRNKSTKNKGSVQEIVTGYLQIKNGLANDNGTDAANGGKIIVGALQGLDTSSLSMQQKKILKDASGDIIENAEHISENSNKIDHQREHFEMLSEEMYDLVKASASNQKLYKDYCPMYNKEGAIWISETKEIKNPYLGKKMLTCGKVKEEIKK